MFSINQLIVLFALISCVFCGSCDNPEVTVSSFSTRDATIVSQVAYIGEFTLKCSNPSGEKSTLFAELDGKIFPVARIGDANYQISWSEDIKKSRSGDFIVRLFDDEGFASIRKAQRSGENLQSVKALAEIIVNHPGAYKGPWINSELLAAVVAACIAYFAFTTKSKIFSSSI